jgi:hypothetical protein
LIMREREKHRREQHQVREREPEDTSRKFHSSGVTPGFSIR